MKADIESRSMMKAEAEKRKSMMKAEEEKRKSMLKAGAEKRKTHPSNRTEHSMIDVFNMFVHACMHLSNSEKYIIASS